MYRHKVHGGSIMITLYADGGIINHRICVYDTQTKQYLVTEHTTGITNNQLEYLSLIAAITHYGQNYYGKPVKIIMDSQLIVRHVQGKYVCRDKSLRELLVKVQALMRRYGVSPSVIEWIERGHNVAGRHLDALRREDRRYKYRY